MRRAAGLALALSVLGVQGAAACPICDSDRAEEVRAGLADDALGRNLLAAALPFGLLAGLVALVHFGPARGPHARALDDKP
jgi:hypothetical protein